MQLSRQFARAAQNRESLTVQPKEKLSGNKATLTIKNYIGGYYYFTSDEIRIEKDTVFLIEGKHSNRRILPSLEDIKDGLVKMILFSNLTKVTINDKEYSPIAVLKLTSNIEFDKDKLNSIQYQILKLLKKEAKQNNFIVLVNNKNLESIEL